MPRRRRPRRATPRRARPHRRPAARRKAAEAGAHRARASGNRLRLPARHGQNDPAIALNRKNALFAGSDGGAAHWATVASLIETCKLNGVEPYAISPTSSPVSSKATRRAASTTSSPGPTRPPSYLGPWPDDDDYHRPPANLVPGDPPTGPPRRARPVQPVLKG